MKNKVVKLIPLFLFTVLLSFVSGCIEQRVKEITTDQSGNAESSVPITQNAKISFLGFTSSKLNCGSELSIQISFLSKDIIRDNFVFVDKGVVIEDLKPVTVRSGDVAKIKITRGCPDSKYVINFSLDNGD